MIQPETIAGRKQYFRKRRLEFVSTWVTDADGVVHIPLRDGLEALIDVCDKDNAADFYWHAHKDGPRNKFYVEAPVCEERRNELGRRISLHRLILQPKGKQTVDHVNGNPLDCRRSNLRLATVSQNASNRNYPRSLRSPYRGVHRSNGNRWLALIEVNNRHLHLGCFGSAEDAARAYNDAALHHFGDFAVLNTV